MSITTFVTRILAPLTLMALTAAAAPQDGSPLPTQTTSPTPSTSPSLKPMIKVGPTPLPAFVALVFFGPFSLCFIVWVIYRKTIHRCIMSRRARNHAAGEEEKRTGKDVEFQVLSLVKPEAARLKEQPGDRAADYRLGEQRNHRLLKQNHGVGEQRNLRIGEVQNSRIGVAS